MASGTVSNPEKGYHFEITAGSETLAKDIRKIFNSFTDISAKIVKRKKGIRRVPESKRADKRYACNNGGKQSVL